MWGEGAKSREGGWEGRGQEVGEQALRTALHIMNLCLQNSFGEPHT